MSGHSSGPRHPLRSGGRTLRPARLTEITSLKALPAGRKRIRLRRVGRQLANPYALANLPARRGPWRFSGVPKAPSRPLGGRDVRHLSDCERRAIRFLRFALDVVTVHNQLGSTDPRGDITGDLLPSHKCSPTRGR